MVLAQRLYEAGKITYMRTDSLNLSQQAINQALSKITADYGQAYSQTRTYKTKSAGAQEAHEAIRPTNFNEAQAGADHQQQRLYELIWKRSLASQMADARLEKTQANIAISGTTESLIAKGEVILFDGFLKVYLEDSDDEDTEDNKLLPPLIVGESLSMLSIEASQIFDRPKPRYTEASLVKKLEEEGIGRPSTYAPTISTIQDRGYVEKGDLEGAERQLIILRLKNDTISRQTKTEITGADKNKLVPTTIGTLVSDFLVKHVPKIVDYQFTANVEEEFDAIAEGKKAWNKMIADFYKPFHETVELTESVSRAEASQARDLGTDPKSGKPVIARLGRYGPMVQIGVAEDEDKPKFASIPPGKKMETITLDDALTLFNLPRSLGDTDEGEEILANNGRFGPYIKFGTLYVSIKPDDPFTITREKALELIEAKKQAEAEKHIKSFKNNKIAILNGRFGPYISDGSKNVKVPKGTSPEELSLEDCKKLLDAAPSKKKVRKRIYKPTKS
jgi:DNA topoisomerase I